MPEQLRAVGKGGASLSTAAVGTLEAIFLSRLREQAGDTVKFGKSRGAREGKTAQFQSVFLADIDVLCGEAVGVLKTVNAHSSSFVCWSGGILRSRLPDCKPLLGREHGAQTGREKL